MAKAPKYETVAEGIRQEIRAGIYAGGVALDMGELAGKYGTTKATVSRGLAFLGDAGLVTPSGGGWTVAEGLLPVEGADTESSAERDATEPEMDVHVPQVLQGTRVVTEHVDPNAERALKREGVAEAYREVKALGRAWLEAEGRATEVKKAVAAKLMELRQIFTYKGDPDYNGQSSEYQALAKLLYQDIGADASAQRAILHHVEDCKRVVIPPAQWAKFGVNALTRGERAGLERKTAKALAAVSETTETTAVEARNGKATGRQLVTLMSSIDQGMAVFSTASLRVMTPAERRRFADQARETRERAEALLRELEGLEE